MLSHLKKIGKHSLIYGGGLLFSKAVGFFLIPLYTHYLSPKDYGVLEIIDLAGFMLSFFIIMGINESILKFYHEYSSIEEKQEVISTAIIFNILVGFLILIILIPNSKFISQIILGKIEFNDLFILMFFSIYFGSIVDIGKTVLRTKNESILFSLISLTFTLFAVLLNIYFIVIQELGIKGIFYSSIIVTFFIALFLIIRIISETGVKFKIKKLRQMLKYSLPFVPAAIFSFILMWSDRYVLRLYHDLETIGHYALGAKMSFIVGFLITMPFGLVWGSYLFEISKNDDAKDIYSKITTYFLAALMFVGLIISVYSYELIVIMAAPSFLPAYTVIPWLILGFAFMTADNVFKVGLIIKGKSGYLPLTKGIAAVLNLILNFTLIPNYGMLGAAWATAISFFAYITLLIWFAQKTYYIEYEIRRILKLILVSVLIYSVSKMITEKEIIYSILLKGIAIGFFPLLLFYVKFFSIEEIQFLKNIYYKIRKIPVEM